MIETQQLKDLYCVNLLKIRAFCSVRFNVKVLFSAQNVQPTTIFFDLNQRNSKYCLYNQDIKHNHCFPFAALLFFGVPLQCRDVVNRDRSFLVKADFIVLPP